MGDRRRRPTVAPPVPSRHGCRPGADGPRLGAGPLAETFPFALSPLELDLWIPPVRRAIAETVILMGAASRRAVRRSPIVVDVDGHVAVDLDLVEVLRGGARPPRPTCRSPTVGRGMEDRPAPSPASPPSPPTSSPPWTSASRPSPRSPSSTTRTSSDPRQRAPAPRGDPRPRDARRPARPRRRGDRRQRGARRGERGALAGPHRRGDRGQVAGDPARWSRPGSAACCSPRGSRPTRGTPQPMSRARSSRLRRAGSAGCQLASRSSSAADSPLDTRSSVTWPTSPSRSSSPSPGATWSIVDPKPRLGAITSAPAVFRLGSDGSVVAERPVRLERPPRHRGQSGRAPGRARTPTPSPATSS